MQQVWFTVYSQVTHLAGHGRITGAREVAVLHPDGKIKEVVKTKNILIATGSEVTPFPGIEVRKVLVKNVLILVHSGPSSAGVNLSGGGYEAP